MLALVSELFIGMKAEFGQVKELNERLRYSF
jgi:hypothetical protein